MAYLSETNDVAIEYLPIRLQRCMKKLYGCYGKWLCVSLCKHNGGGCKKKYSDESINGLEEIMDILKEGRQLRVESAEERLLLYLTDYIWRYNHRNDNIQLQKKLILKQLEK